MQALDDRESPFMVVQEVGPGTVEQPSIELRGHCTRRGHCYSAPSIMKHRSVIGYPTVLRQAEFRLPVGYLKPTEWAARIKPRAKRAPFSSETLGLAIRETQ